MTQDVPSSGVPPPRPDASAGPARPGTRAQASAMSVIVVADPGGDPLRPLLRALRRQTIRDRLELVVVSWGDGRALEGQDISGFAAVRSLSDPTFESIGEARAAAIRAAVAPAVVFAELHSFPEPGWAEALLRRLDEGWAGVGPIVRNHNPFSAASWTTLLTGFGEWLDERRGGRASALPWHSSAYRRDLLLARGEALGELLEVEWLLQQALLEEGHGFWVEPEARTSHVNVSRLRAMPGVEFFSGRLFAGIAAHRRGLSRAQRAALAVTRPVAFVPRLLRVLRRVPAEPDVRRRLPGVLSLTAAAVAAHLAGEAVGYAAGAGPAKRRRIDVECRRMGYVRPDDRKAWEAEARATASAPE